MAKITLDTKGLESYFKKIADAGKRVDAAAVKALIAGGKVLQEGMIRRAPEDTHNLKNHIRIKGPLTDKEGSYYVEVGVIHDIEFTDAETARYANTQEFGSSSMPAHPYVRPAKDEDWKKVKDVMRDVLEKEGII